MTLSRPFRFALLALALGIFFYSPPLVGPGFGLAKLLALAGLGVLVLGWGLRRSLPWAGALTAIVGGYGALCAVALAWPVLLQSYDFKFAQSLVVVGVETALGLVALGALVRGMDRGTVLDAALVAGTAQAGFMILALASPTLRAWVFANLDTGAADQFEQTGFRGLAFASTATYALSVLQGALVGLAVLRAGERNRFWPGCAYVLAAGLLLVSVALAGRTGLVVAAGTGLCVLIVQARHMTAPVWAAAGMILALLIGAGLVAYDEVGPVWRGVIDLAASWTFEPLIAFARTGQLASVSTDILWDMYFPLPGDTLWVGDGRYEGRLGTNYYQATDAGYMRFALYWGVWASMAFYAWVGFVLGQAIRAGRSRSAATGAYMAALAVLFFVVQIKGPILISNMGFKVMMALTVLWVLGPRPLPDHSAHGMVKG